MMEWRIKVAVLSLNWNCIVLFLYMTFKLSVQNQFKIWNVFSAVHRFCYIGYRRNKTAYWREASLPALNIDCSCCIRAANVLNFNHSPFFFSFCKQDIDPEEEVWKKMILVLTKMQSADTQSFRFQLPIWNPPLKVLKGHETAPFQTKSTS